MSHPALAPDTRDDRRPAARINTPGQVLFASLIGTTIEFFDFYIYGTAAVLVFPILFFPSSDPATAILASFATFAIAFIARPIGSALFGHFGDRVGRKTTLVAALLTMGLMVGAIGSHLTVLGIAVRGDGGLLFGLAVTSFIGSALVLLIRRAQIPVLARLLEV